MSDQRGLGTVAAPSVGQNNGPTNPVPAAPKKAASKGWAGFKTLRTVLLVAAVIVAGIAGYFTWKYFQPPKLPEGFAKSNGRIEATEIDIAAKNPGRIMALNVDEGDLVTAGQVLAQMDIDVLTAQLNEAQADHRQAVISVETAKSNVTRYEYEKEAAKAQVEQRNAEFDLARFNLARAEAVAKTQGAISKEELDVRQSNVHTARAAVSTAKANVEASNAAISAAKSKVVEAEASIEAAKAKIQRLEADIRECSLKAPRDGRVQYRVSQLGEVLPGGGKVLNMVDLGDVYMTFFLPTDWAGRVQIGAEARLVLDAAPQFVIPAKVTFVSDVAQFTPKAVETAEERQKLTFRIKAHIEKDLLKKYVRDVKTGLPGVAYVQLDPQAEWPAYLKVNLPDERPGS